MFTKTERPTTELDQVYFRALVELQKHNAASEEYGRVLDRITKIRSMQEAEAPATVSREVLITVAANLLGIAMILTHERANVITTKAIGFVPKLR